MPQRAISQDLLNFRNFLTPVAGILQVSATELPIPTVTRPRRATKSAFPAASDISGGIQFMQRSIVAVLCSSALCLILSGCASSTPAIRGQGPGEWVSGPSAAPCPNCQSAHPGHAQGHCNLPFVPVHRNFHTYSVPDGLMYPPENLPPAMYQYPYYTLRGPTDFFQK